MEADTHAPVGKGAEGPLLSSNLHSGMKDTAKLERRQRMSKEDVQVLDACKPSSPDARRLPSGWTHATHRRCSTSPPKPFRPQNSVKSGFSPTTNTRALHTRTRKTVIVQGNRAVIRNQRGVTGAQRESANYVFLKKKLMVYI